MTGWRMGWLTHPPQLGPLLDSLIEYNTSGTQSFIHMACVTALEEGENFVQENVARCRRGGELVYEALRQIPRVRIAAPQGSFYSFFAVEGMDSSLDFCKQLCRTARSGWPQVRPSGPVVRVICGSASRLRKSACQKHWTASKNSSGNDLSKAHSP